MKRYMMFWRLNLSPATGRKYLSVTANTSIRCIMGVRNYLVEVQENIISHYTSYIIHQKYSICIICNVNSPYKPDK